VWRAAAAFANLARMTRGGPLLRLDGGGQTMLLAVGVGPPALAYCGPALPEDVDAAAVEALSARARSGGTLDGGEAFDLFPEAGRGFTGHPALALHRDDGSFVTQLAFVEARAEGDAQVISLADPEAGIEVALRVELDAGSGVAAFRSRLVNTGADALHVDWMAAAALPLAQGEVMLWGGRWSMEFQTTRQQLADGLIVKDNRTGRTSHHAPPFAVVGQSGFGESHGEALGLHLAWSGDARLLFERLRDGRRQAQAGELFLPGELTLAPGEAYETPVLYAAQIRDRAERPVGPFPSVRAPPHPRRTAHRQAAAGELQHLGGGLLPPRPRRAEGVGRPRRAGGRRAVRAR
jgi:alpha-galactosidase